MRLLHDLADGSAGKRPEQPAISFQGAELSFAALADSSARTAGGLHASGLEAGDRVAIYVGNRPELVEVALACSRLGAIFVPLSPMLRARQLAHAINDSGARFLVTSTMLLDQVRQASIDCPKLHAIVLVGASETPSALGSHLTCMSIDELRSFAPHAAARVGDGEPAAILYTSGSTGRSKGVVISHRNLVAGAEIVSDYLGNTSDDRLLAALPLSFDYGLSQVTTALHVGACAVLTSFSLPAALVREVVAERITGLAGVPTMWSPLAAVEWPDPTVSSLRYITNSGGALSSATIRQLRSRLPSTRIFCMYGLTEAFRSTFLDPEQIDARPGSIGTPLAGQQVFIVRPDSSRCEAGEVGELIHRGSLVTLGYWGNPTATAHRFRPVPASMGKASATERAVWSGDLARMDEDGFLYFVARADSMIKTSGYRVSPLEIEEVAAEVEGVVECVALGINDDVLGQRIVLAIVPQAASADVLEGKVRRHCKMQLPAYMVPNEIHLLDSIPRNANGKPDRHALADSLTTDGRRFAAGG